MKAYQTIVSVVAALGLAGATAVPAADVGTAFTYQGQLKKGGRAVNGTCGLEFTLWGAEVSPPPVPPTLIIFTAKTPATSASGRRARPPCWILRPTRTQLNIFT